MAGFEFKETMSGSWRREGSSEAQPMAFTIRAHAGRLLRHLVDHKAEIEGRLQMAGFAEDVPISGELTINPLLGKKIRYEFAFEADDGKRYRFVGQKDVQFLDVVRTMTELPGEILDQQGGVIGRADLKFDTNDLPSFLASFRPSFYAARGWRRHVPLSSGAPRASSQHVGLEAAAFARIRIFRKPDRDDVGRAGPEWHAGVPTRAVGGAAGLAGAADEETSEPRAAASGARRRSRVTRRGRRRRACR